MKKILIAICIFFNTSFANAEPAMQPINKIILKMNKTIANGETPKPLAIAYVGLRCGALLGAVSGRLIENGDGITDVQSAKKLLAMAEDFNFTAILIYANNNEKKISTEEVKQRSLKLNNAYLKEISKNKSIDTPLIAADLKSCNEEFNGYSSIAKKYQQQTK
jgi:hypothetical protein